MAEVSSLDEWRVAARGDVETSASTRDSGTSGARAAAALDLVRSIGLSDLVRPATTGAGIPAVALRGVPAGLATSNLTTPSLTTSSAETSEVAVPSAVAEVAAGGDATPLIEGALALAVEPDPLVGVFPWRGEPDRVLPVDAQLRGLLPEGGLRRGTSVSVSGATSLLIGMLTEASRAGSWCAIVGLPTLGMVAAAESGMALARTALVPHPGLEWTGIVAALLDGFDIVAVVPSGSIAAHAARRLAARARQRGSVLMTYGAFPGADLRVRATRSQWLGLERGCGRLRRRELIVVANGRGSATRPRTVRATMPDAQALNESWAPRVDWVDRDIDSGAERPDLALVSTVE